MMEKDPYYQVDRVSNSFLSELKQKMKGIKKPGNIEDIFEEGTQFHYAVLEPERVNVDGPYYERIIKMKDVAIRDRSVALFINPGSGRKIEHEYYPEIEGVACKAKMDCVIESIKMGLDLKSTSCKTQWSFDIAIDHFNIDRQCAFYMDVAGLDMILIFAVSKHNPHNSFKFVVRRGDERYIMGRAKYMELLNYYKLMFL